MPDKVSRADHRLTFRHLEQLMEQLLDGVILLDPTGAILSANAAALQMHGVDDVAALGATAEDYARRFSLRSEKGARMNQRDYPLFRLLAGDSFPDLVVQVAPAGEDEARWVHQVRDVVMDEDGGEPDYLALVISDVSERFDAEARFEAMFRANPAPALVLRLHDHRIARVNPGFEAMTGYAPDQLVGRMLGDLHLLDAPEASAVRARIEAGEVVPQTEAELTVADGSRRLVLFAGQPVDVTDEDALLITFADLEPRRQAEDALAGSERHLAAIFEMAPVAMVVTHREGGVIARCNGAFRDLTGYGEDALAGSTLAHIGLWRSPELATALDSAVASGDGLRNRDGQIVASDGTVVDVLISAETTSMDGAACVLWLFHDITERRRTELELVEAIEAVMKDASWLSRSILDKLASVRRPGAPVPSAELSVREREILELICDDFDNAAIADRLGLSRNTVRNHVARLYAKIGVNRRSGAVVWGRERGMGRLRD